MNKTVIGLVHAGNERLEQSYNVLNKTVLGLWAGNERLKLTYNVITKIVLHLVQAGNERLK